MAPGPYAGAGRAIRLRSRSTSSTVTHTRCCTLTTSEGLLTNPSASWLMCASPSWRRPTWTKALSRVNHICRFLLPHREMLPKNQRFGSSAVSVISGIPSGSGNVASDAAYQIVGHNASPLLHPPLQRTQVRPAESIRSFRVRQLRGALARGSRSACSCSSRHRSAAWPESVPGSRHWVQCGSAFTERCFRPGADRLVAHHPVAGRGRWTVALDHR